MCETKYLNCDLLQNTYHFGCKIIQKTLIKRCFSFTYNLIIVHCTTQTKISSSKVFFLEVVYVTIGNPAFCLTICKSCNRVVTFVI